MDIATSKSSYDASLEAYEVSLKTINSWRKKIDIILIFGTALSIILLWITFSFFGTRPEFIEGKGWINVHSHASWG